MTRAGLLKVSALAASVCLFSRCGPAPAVSFGVLADCQFAAAPAAGSRFYSYSWLKLREALELFNARGVRFVVHLGDLIDHDAQSYDLILPVVGRSKAPVRLVLGNHDFDVEPGLRSGLPGRLGTGPGYDAFSEGGWRFVVLDGDELGFNHPKDASQEKESAELFGSLLAAGKPNATKWNGGVGRTQVTFLERELARADRKGQSVIVFCHFPVFPAAGHNLWNDDEVVAILERHPSVKAYFGGHNHAGDYAAKNGIHYVTFAGLVETRATGAGAVVTLTKDRISIDGFGREPDRTLALR